jgi:hypothetical protein
MRRDFVFLGLFLVIVASILLYFLQVGETPEPAPAGDGGAAATGTTAADGSSRRPDAKAPEDASSTEAPAEETDEGAPEEDSAETESATAGGGSRRAGLEHVILEVSVDDTELGEAMDVLASESGLTIVVPDHLRGGDEMKVTLHVAKVSVRTVLDLITLTMSLRWEKAADGSIQILDGE